MPTVPLAHLQPRVAGKKAIDVRDFIQRKLHPLHRR